MVIITCCKWDLNDILENILKFFIGTYIIYVHYKEWYYGSRWSDPKYSYTNETLLQCHITEFITF